MNFKIAVLLIFLSGLNCHSPKEPIRTGDAEIFYTEVRSASVYRQPMRLENKPVAVSIFAVGDIMLGEHVTHYLNNHGLRYPFDSTLLCLPNAHFTIGNLEAPFATSGKKFEKRFNFKVNPRYAPALTIGGFNVVNLANNHIMDFGKEALITTLNTLDSLNVKYCGAGLNYEQARRPAILEASGIKVAFLGYSLTFPSEFWATKDSAGTCYPYENDMVQSIQNCERIADFTVVSFHWGQELRDTPKEYQQYFAHLAIDAGADLILGHHPHVLQGIEIYRNRLIMYSLGNFVFGSYSHRAKDSVILKTYLTSNGLLFARLFPISVYNDLVAFQPRFLRGKKVDDVLSYLNSISLPINNNRSIIENDGIIWGDWFGATDSLWSTFNLP